MIIGIFCNIVWDGSFFLKGGGRGGERERALSVDEFCKIFMFCFNIPHLPSKSLECLVPGQWGRGRC